MAVALTVSVARCPLRPHNPHMDRNANLNAAPARIIDADAGTFRERFNRGSFSFRHSLHRHPLFTLPRLAQLAETMLAAGDKSKFLALGGEDAAPGSSFESLPRRERFARTVEDLAGTRNWVKLSSADSFDPQYRELLAAVLAEIAPLTGGDLLGQITWSSLTVFLASPRIVTPYHIDHESNFLFQVAGEKDLFLFDCDDRTVLTELEIESYYAGDFRAARHKAELQERAASYRLVPGVAAHHPPLAPHWVRNGEAPSVSVSIGFCMRPVDARARVYQANHYLRKLGLQPAPPGISALRDHLKGAALGALSKSRPDNPNEILYSGLNRLKTLVAPLSYVRDALRGGSR
jgi:hypothetical protein